MEMKESGIDWINSCPASWKMSRIQNHLYEINEKNNPVKMTEILSLTNTEGVIPYSERGNQGNKSKEDLTEYKVVYKDSIVANSMNILIGSVGLSYWDGCVSPVYYVYKAKPNNDIRYFNYLFRTEAFQKELRKYANGILEIRLRVSSSDILKRSIFVPSYEEQKAIADYLDEKCKAIDIAIEEAKKSIENYKTYKKAIVTELTTKGIDKSVSYKDSGNEWIGNIPEHWNVYRVKHIANTISKGSGITREDVDKNGEIPCVRYGEIYTKYNDAFSECVSRTNLDKVSSPVYISRGDILFAATGELPEEIGKNIVYMGNEKCLAGGDIIILKHNQDPKFLCYSLNSNCSQSQKSQNKAKLKVVHISGGDIGDIQISIPPVDEQKRIVSIIDDKSAKTDLAIAEKEAVIDELNAYKKSLIYDCVTGKKEVI